MRRPQATGLQPPGSTGAADQYASHTTPASCAPGLPTLKGPMWSSLSITRTMPEARGKRQPIRQAMSSWMHAGAAWCTPIEQALGQVPAGVVPLLLLQNPSTAHTHSPSTSLEPSSHKQPDTTRLPAALSTTKANQGCQPTPGSPSIRSDTNWKDRVCLPSPNSVSGSFFSAWKGEVDRNRCQMS